MPEISSGCICPRSFLRADAHVEWPLLPTNGRERAMQPPDSTRREAIVTVVASGPPMPSQGICKVFNDWKGFGERPTDGCRRLRWRKRPTDDVIQGGRGRKDGGFSGEGGRLKTTSRGEGASFDTQISQNHWEIMKIHDFSSKIRKKL